MSLSNIYLQIITKYIYDFKTINELLKINNNLKYYYSTFEFVHLPIRYILPDSQIRKIIIKLNSLFPNLNEIILNFEDSNINKIYLFEFYNCVIRNYLNFMKYINFNKNNVKLKMNFNFNIILAFFCFINGDKTFDVILLRELLKRNIINCSINILFDVDNDFKLNECFELYNKFKHPNLNFIIKLYDIYEYKEFKNMNDKYKNNDGFYFSYLGTDIYFNSDEGINNIYIKNYFEKFKLSFLNDINNFPLFYEIIKCKNKKVINNNIHLLIIENKYIDIILNNLYYNLNNMNIKYIIINENLIYTSKNEYYKKYINIHENVGFYNNDDKIIINCENVDENMEYRYKDWFYMQNSIKSYNKIKNTYDI